MKKGTKIALVVAAVLFVTGAVACGVAFWGVGFDWYALSAAEPGDYETKTQAFDAAELSKVALEVGMDDVRIVPSGDAQIHLRYTNRPAWRYTLTVEEGVLTMTQQSRNRGGDIRSWFHFDLGVKDQEVRLELPKNFDGDLSLQGDVGEISLEEISLQGALNCAVQTGDFDAKNLTAASVTVQGDVGSIEGENWDVKQAVFLRAQTGDITLENSHVGSDLTCQNDVGSTSLDRVSAITADLSAQTGDLDFTSLGIENLKAVTDTGEVSGSLDGLQSEYTILTDSDTGDCSPKSQRGTTEKEIKITTQVGDINLTFLR